MSDDKRKRRPPLTEAQRATVTQWYPLAVRYMLLALRKRGLDHFFDEAEGLASEAAVLAAYAWVPSRGSFPSCLKWWVKSVVDKFNCHGARTVQQSEHARDFVDAWSLNATIHHNQHGGSEESLTWLDVLEDDAIMDPAEPVDAARLFRAAEIEITRLLEEESRYSLPEGAAKDFYRVWLDREMGDDDTPMHLIGWAWGVSRQMCQIRVEKVRGVFERWASGLREEVT